MGDRPDDDWGDDEETPTPEEIAKIDAEIEVEVKRLGWN